MSKKIEIDKKQSYSFEELKKYLDKVVEVYNSKEKVQEEKKTEPKTWELNLEPEKPKDIPEEKNEEKEKTTEIIQVPFEVNNSKKEENTEASVEEEKTATDLIREYTFK